MVQKAAAMVYAGSMHAISFARPGRTAGRCRLAMTVILVATGLAAAGQESAGLSFPGVTNIAQLRRLSPQEPNVKYSIRLEGNIWWASRGQGKFVLQDESGAEELEMDFQSQPVQSGQRVRLEGNGSVTLSFVGVANYTYLVEATLDLTPPVVWTPVSTNTADINGLWQFTDTQATNYTQQFYRSVYRT